MKLKKKIKVAIDSPSAAGAGSISKKIAKHYNLIYCDTGKIYRLLGYYKINNSHHSLTQKIADCHFQSH